MVRAWFAIVEVGGEESRSACRHCKGSLSAMYVPSGIVLL